MTLMILTPYLGEERDEGGDEGGASDDPFIVARQSVIDRIGSMILMSKTFPFAFASASAASSHSRQFSHRPSLPQTHNVAERTAYATQII